MTDPIESLEVILFPHLQIYRAKTSMFCYLFCEKVVHHPSSPPISSPPQFRLMYLYAQFRHQFRPNRLVRIK